MIHYHGTPLSGPGDRVGRFFRGRHALVSFAAQDQMAVVADVCQSFVLDNSAYTLWGQGKKMTPDLVEKVLAFYFRWGRLPTCDGVFIMDMIDGNEADNDALISDFPKELRGIPIWHYHESFERLERLANEYPTIAFGSSGEWPTPGNEKWWKRTNDAMAVICDEDGLPPCRLHGLRMLGPDIFTKLPFASADSTYVARTCGLDKRHGKGSSVHIWQRANNLADNIEMYQSAERWLPQDAIQMEFQEFALG